MGGALNRARKVRGWLRKRAQGPRSCARKCLERKSRAQWRLCAVGAQRYIQHTRYTVTDARSFVFNSIRALAQCVLLFSHPRPAARLWRTNSNGGWLGRFRVCVTSVGIDTPRLVGAADEQRAVRWVLLGRNRRCSRSSETTPPADGTGRRACFHG